MSVGAVAVCEAQEVCLLYSPHLVTMFVCVCVDNVGDSRSYMCTLSAQAAAVVVSLFPPFCDVTMSALLCTAFRCMYM